MNWTAAAPGAAERFLSSGRARLDPKLIPSLSAPFITAISPDWAHADARILLVGQETFGWGGGRCLADPIERLAHWLDTRDVEALARCYQEFDFGASYLSTPLWGFHARLAAAFEQGNGRAIAWSNVVRVDTGPMGAGTRSTWRNLTDSEFRSVCHWQTELFHAELAALQPRAIVFVSSWRYDDALRVMFPDAEFEPIGPSGTVRELARVAARGLPAATFRTYHPGYLQRARRNDLLDAAVELVGQAKKW